MLRLIDGSFDLLLEITWWGTVEKTWDVIKKIWSWIRLGEYSQGKNELTLNIPFKEQDYSKRVTPVLNPWCKHKLQYSELTGCHCAGYQAGGQLKRLQACTVLGLCWRHRSSARITVSFISLERIWEQKTSLVCRPTPQVRLHGLHLPTSHLGRNQRREHLEHLCREHCPWCEMLLLE